MKFRLLADHVNSDQQVIPAGTKAGDDTAWTWRDREGKPLPVSTQMDGLDDEGRQMVNDLHQTLYGRPAPYWEPIEAAPVRAAREKEAAEQQKLDEGSQPVSEQQARERAAAERAGKTGELPQPVSTPPGPGRQPSHTATAAPTTGGSVRPAPGVATPQAPKPDELRPKKPNEEQYPKG